jgi:hypothetical protein
MALCRPCHSWITDHPQLAAMKGWTVKRSQVPGEVPCQRFGEFVILLDDGGFEPVEKGAA